MYWRNGYVLASLSLIHAQAEEFMTGTTVTPLLFGKRKPVAPVLAAQYHGTDTELDLKGAR